MAVLVLNDLAGFAAESASGVTLAESPVTPFEQWDVSYSVAAVSDNRRSGVTRSGHAAALQLGVEFEHASGWSFGAHASTVDKRKGGHFEADLHVARRFEVGETEFTVGALWAMIPEADHQDFGIAQFSASHPVGPLDVTLAVNYAWKQENIDDEDNLYVGLRARTPIGRIAGAPITLGASVGHAAGPLAIEGTKLDWSLSAAANVNGADFGVAYVDTDLHDHRGSAALVFSIAVRF